MADNTRANANSTTGDLIRSVDLGGVKTQVMKLDLGGEGSEIFPIGGQLPVTFTSPATASLSVHITGAVANQAIVTPAGGETVYVTRLTVTTANSNTGDCAFHIGCGATTPTTTNCILSHPGMANNSSVTVGDGLGTIGVSPSVGLALRITCSDPTGSINVDVTYNLA